MSAADFLPGFESIGDLLAATPSNVSDDDLAARQDPRYRDITLERIKAERPDLVQTVARAFFGLGLSYRDISYQTGLHRNTVKAIVDAEDASEVVKGIRRTKVLTVHRLGNIALANLEQLLKDPAAVKKAGINGVLDAVRRLADIEQELDQRLNESTVDAPAIKGFQAASVAEEYLN